MAPFELPIALLPPQTSTLSFVGQYFFYLPCSFIPNRRPHENRYCFLTLGVHFCCSPFNAAFFLFILFFLVPLVFSFSQFGLLFAVSLGNIFQYLHVNHEKHVKFVCLVKTSLLRLLSWQLPGELQSERTKS